MAEWLYEAGIGESRAILVDRDRIVVARIEPDGVGPLVGTVSGARLTEIIVKGREGRVTLDSGEEAMCAPLPAAITQGAKLTVAILREVIPEPGRTKLARCLPSDAAPTPGPDLLARISASGHPIRQCRAHEADHFEAAGWSEVLEEATSGEIVFAGGALRLSPTPAMTLFDVDGSGPLEALAIAAASAIGSAIVRHGITGSIGIDFPTLSGKEARQAVAAAIDAALPLPFERTAMNGFGFLQIVRPRHRASLPERLRIDPAGAEARALLRMIERIPPPAPRHHIVSRRVADLIAMRSDWREELARRTGVEPIFETR
ncbi:ribonuclease [Sphingomonas sp. So64.6b]|uniref:ribonuclease n=1 Tax=Sphingomonas sp. So64.6b TaxID=2997354 RepID=UPI0015FEFA83|nr:ribonuclease [Sphingomonas sp. So64.6b]QNA86243.1 ribonuclease [Sphingomonas sp. So64.6b]